MNIKVEKLVFGGQGLGYLNGQACFVWGALPNEEVEVEIKKNKGNFTEGIIREIIKKSSERLEPKEEHYLSCSPWQIMSFEAENSWKREIAEETYKKLGNIKIGKLEIVSDNVEYGYRNKMEYSFVKGNGDVSLAFHVRESRQYLPIHVCELARPEINEVALNLLVWVNKNKIPIRSLKTMIVRCNQKGEVLAGLFLKDRLEFDSYLEVRGDLIGLPQLNQHVSNIDDQKKVNTDVFKLPAHDTHLTGLTVFYSTHKSPASVPTAVLYQHGQEYLEEELFNTRLRYGLFSFFQINVPVFKKALEDIDKFVENTDLVDYYSGVGSIGLALHDRCKQLNLVESNPEAVGYAKVNIELNKLKNCEVFCKPAEKMADLITSNKTIIFDPPRAGLNKRVVEKVLAELPKKIIYLSCDLATHARDIGLLKGKYKIKFLKLYNFFPRTAHIEGLCVLEKT